MKRELARESLQQLTIKSPCTVGWETMSGDEKMRFCEKCNLNVYNISAMSDEEAFKVVSNKPGRTCVFLRRNDAGVIVTDNCPVALRQVRARIALSAVVGVLTITYGLTLYAVSQGIAISSLTIDPRYGQINGVGQMADLGYHRARDVARMATIITTSVCCFVPMDKRIRVKQAIIELLALASIPILVHIIGTHLTNNFGGLGGGGI